MILASSLVARKKFSGGHSINCIPSGISVIRSPSLVRHQCFVYSISTPRNSSPLVCASVYPCQKDFLCCLGCFHHLLLNLLRCRLQSLHHRLNECRPAPSLPIFRLLCPRPRNCLYRLG